MIVPGTEQVITDPNGQPVRDPADLEAEAEWARVRLAPMPVLGQIKTPDDVIEDLEVAKHLAAKCALTIKDADKTKRAVTRVTMIAHGKALRASDGKSAELREADAFDATEALHELQDNAEIVYDFARNVAKSVEQSTSALQTQAKMVAITYGLAGSGRQS